MGPENRDGTTSRSDSRLVTCCKVSQSVGVFVERWPGLVEIVTFEAH